jgi:hypothetical protein
MMDSSEQRQVLDMLADGRIDAADAERLLERLAEVSSAESAPASSAARRPLLPNELHLHIVARTTEGDDVDVRIPLKLMATGIEFEKLLPEAAREAVGETGIQLAELRNLRGDQLIEAIQDLEVDLEGHDGSRVSICCD